MNALVEAFGVHGPFAFSEIGALPAVVSPLDDAKIRCSHTAFCGKHLLVDAERPRPGHHRARTDGL